MKNYKVKEITYQDTKDFILNKHYAQRMPSVSWAFGLFHHDKLVGVLTIGKPASRPLCIGILGVEHADKVYELNRLITEDDLEQNALSFFVGRSLRKLKGEDLVIVSFADEGVGHYGYIYQATNFIYTGRAKERTDNYMPGNKHPRHYDETYAHLRKLRTAKHRYVFFTKNKRLAEKMNYPVLPYPKGENRKYELGTRMQVMVLNQNTGEVFAE
ncbi:hypothetical protein EauM23_00056 [Exiguobacterium phage vB_EauM-23]|nr:hypothetical protein EauM23_00056 [Exiguobacterium phage vB_EauM-23]